MTHSDHDGPLEPTLLGLSVEETREFLRLDEIASQRSEGGEGNWSVTEEQRWLELFEKKHAAAMRPFLNVKQRP